MQTRFLMLTRTQLTFHLGDDRYWSEKRFNDYNEFNRKQARNLASTLASNPEKAKRLRDFIYAHERSGFRNWRTIGAHLCQRTYALTFDRIRRLSGN